MRHTALEANLGRSHFKKLLYLLHFHKFHYSIWQVQRQQCVATTAVKDQHQCSNMPMTQAGRRQQYHVIMIMSCKSGLPLSTYARLTACKRFQRLEWCISCRTLAPRTHLRPGITIIGGWPSERAQLIIVAGCSWLQTADRALLSSRVRAATYSAAVRPVDSAWCRLLSRVRCLSDVVSDPAFSQ